MPHSSPGLSVPMIPSPPPSQTVPNVSPIDLGDLRDRLVAHPIYSIVDGPERVRRFMETHVFAVWDFMSLLKALQQRLTCTSVPWFPTADAEARRLINEVVLDEESDALPEGGYSSHFELYLDCMRQAGADTGPIERLLESLRQGTPFAEALGACGCPPEAADFVRKSFAVIESGSTPALAAAFTYGREDVIPDMFTNLVATLAESDPDAWSGFRYYLDRHIEADGDHHGPICRRIVARLCGDDPAKWAEASAAARECLTARISLWDGIAAAFEATSLVG
jgi:hypothetical protein